MMIKKTFINFFFISTLTQIYVPVVAMNDDDESALHLRPLIIRTNNEDSWGCLDYIWRQVSYCMPTLADFWWKQDCVKNMPRDIILYLSKFLSSEDILIFSQSNNTLLRVFDGDFWLSYAATKPAASSYLLIQGSLSPIFHKKSFFAHLWYVEGKMNKAAKLEHPEALINRDYGIYGIYIKSDEYVCPLKKIRNAQNGKINIEKTELLSVAIYKQTRKNARNQSLFRGIIPKRR